MRIHQATAVCVSFGFYVTVFVIASIATAVLLGIDFYKDRRNGLD